MSRKLLVVLATALQLVACDDPSGPERTARLVFLESPDSVPVSGAVLLGVRAETGRGAPAEGVAVVLRDSAGAEVDRALTDAEGLVTLEWQVPLTPGMVDLEAFADGATASATLRVHPGPAAILMLASGGGQLGVAGAALPLPLVLQVTDAFGNPRAGETIRLAIAGGGGEVDPAEAITTADGRVIATWRLGPVLGEQQVVARHQTLPEVRATANAATAAFQKLEVYSGAPPTAWTAGAALPAPVVIRAVDVSGQPAAGIQIRFTVNDGGSIDPVDAVTGPDGTASVVWTLGPSAGFQTIRAEASSDGTMSTVGLRVEAVTELRILAPTLAIGRIGAPYLAELQAIAATGSVAWTLGAGAPPGISLGSAGQITGTPAAEGNFAFVVRATDEAGTQSEIELNLVVCAATITSELGQAWRGVLRPECSLLVGGEAGARYRLGVFVSGAGEGEAPNAASGLLVRARIAGRPATVIPIFSVEPDATPAGPASIPTRDSHWAGGPVPSVARWLERTDRPAASAAALSPAAARVFMLPYGIGSVEASLLLQTEHLIFYAEDGLPATSVPSADALQAAGDYFATHVHPVIRDVFGDLAPDGVAGNFSTAPLARDLDGNGRIVVLIHDAGGRYSGAVDPCDRLPNEGNQTGTSPTCEGNQAEIVYVTSTTGVSGERLGSLLAHEVKHLSSIGWNLFAGLAAKPSWVEEGTAEIARELASRSALGLAPDSIPSPDQVEASDGTAMPGAFGLWTAALRGLNWAFHGQRWSLYGPTQGNGAAGHYSASYVLHRYILDRPDARSAGDWMMRLNTEWRGLAQTTGVAFDDLLAGMLQAISVDGESGARSLSSERFSTFRFSDYGFSGQTATYPFALDMGTFADGDFVFAEVVTGGMLFVDMVANGADELDVQILGGTGEPLTGEGERALVVLTRIR